MTLYMIEVLTILVVIGAVCFVTEKYVMEKE